MTYTPGEKTMLYTRWPVYVRDEGGGGIYLVAGNGRYIAHCYESNRRNVGNARRLAALWNMAEKLKLPTEEIETGTIEKAFSLLERLGDLLVDGEEYVSLEIRQELYELTGKRVEEKTVERE